MHSTGGSVGLFEGKKIGRAKNLEKLTEKIGVQKTKVNELKSVITETLQRSDCIQ